MINESYKDLELEACRDIAKDIQEQFILYEIEVMIRIYRRTKSDRNTCFLSHICKRELYYKKSLKSLCSQGFIQLIKSKDPYKITKDGIRIGRIMFMCRELGFL